ncbi:MAG: vitamin K epoxide reductase family protein [Chloroflexi bacterium]|nr:vitamin K epoxide reductase family protein [Chloroflexota bacterium]
MTEPARSSRFLWRPFSQLTLSLAGAGVAAYLTYTHLARTAPFCAGYGGCDVVNASPYAEMLGIPVAALGLGMYLLLALLALLRVLSLGPPAQNVDLSTFGLSLVGVIFSGYLTYLELFVIGAICLWCVASALVVTAIFGLSLYGLLGSSPQEAEAKPYHSSSTVRRRTSRG